MGNFGRRTDFLCTDGIGWYVKENKPARKLLPGDVVTILANVKHWHGAVKNSWFSHIAVEWPGRKHENRMVRSRFRRRIDKLD